MRCKEDCKTECKSAGTNKRRTCENTTGGHAEAILLIVLGLMGSPNLFLSTSRMLATVGVILSSSRMLPRLPSRRTHLASASPSK